MHGGSVAQSHRVPKTRPRDRRWMGRRNGVPRGGENGQFELLGVCQDKRVPLGQIYMHVRLIMGPARLLEVCPRKQVSLGR